MRLSLLVAFALAGCGASVAPAPDRESPDADVTDAPDARQSAARVAPEAGPDAAGLLCCRTGQNLLVCTGGTVDSGPASWTCGDPGFTYAPCTQTGVRACAIGGRCQGFGGVGTIVVCGSGQ